MSKTNHDEFLRDRREALLSLDRNIINAYCIKYDINLPSTDEAFWLAIHKARTASLDLPIEERRISKRYLLSVGSEPWDDGEIEVDAPQEGGE